MFPDDQLFLPRRLAEDYEPLACLGDKPKGRTLLIRRRTDGTKYILRISAVRRYLADEYKLLKDLAGAGFPRAISLCGERVNGQEVFCLLREYIPGQTLLEYVAQHGPMSVREARNTGRKLCRLVEQMHLRKPPIIHRDLKAENIVRTPQGQLALIDMDIARSYHETSRQDTRVSGTPGVAPPEQFGYGQTDTRSDVYAIGVLLRFLLTGEPYGNGRVSNKRMEHIIRKCTAFSPKDRYWDASAVAAALSGVWFWLGAGLTAIAAALVVGLVIWLLPGGDTTPYDSDPSMWACDWTTLEGNYEWEQRSDETWRKVSKVVSYDAEGSVSLADEFEIMFANSIGSRVTQLRIDVNMRRIDDGTFLDAASLRRIVVDEGNAHYYVRDGVLYGADGTLVACPANAFLSVLTIPEGVHTIADYAFACSGGFFTPLKQITLPATLLTVGPHSFEGLSRDCVFIGPENSAVSGLIRSQGFRYESYAK